MKIEKADGLSKRLDWKVDIEKDNKNQTSIKEQQISKLVKVVIEEPRVEIVEKIKTAKEKDEEVVIVVKEVKKAGVKILQGNIKEDLVLKEKKYIYILKNEKLRVKIIRLHHDVPVAGHRERQKTIELVTRKYWWPEVIKDVGKYVNECDIYQRMENHIKVLVRKLIVNEILEKP